MTSSVAEQQLPRVKGPRVWLDMDQKALDDAYDQSVWAPNQRMSANGARRGASRYALVSKPTAISYGPTQIESLTSTRPPGGTRRSASSSRRRLARRSAKDSAYPAEMFVTAGAHYIAVDFVSVDKAER